MRSSHSLAGRALVAVSLMIGFYLLALLVAGLLIAVIVAMVKADHLNLKVGAFCAIGAGIILWSILPRLDRFRAPGPELKTEQNPRLFTMIREVAAAVGQKMPSEVYLVGDVNAWVAERGGLMGIGSRRVIGLGLPLIGVLSVDQLRAVIAHEFGHYDSGDTKLGPWIYKTRASIIRTVMNLGESESWLDKPFRWYGEMYLRVTQGISRQQEFSADAIAARVVGAEHFVAGLTTIAAAAAAYPAFWDQEMSGPLDRGFRPPVLEGFRSFFSSPHIAPQRRKYVEALVKEGKADPYDSHPSLGERAAALGLEVDPDAAGAGESAALLLGDATAEELRLLRLIFGDEVIDRMRPMPWSELADCCRIANWRFIVKKFAPLFPEGRLQDLPSLFEGEPVRTQLPKVFKTLEGARQDLTDAEKREVVTVAFLGYALVLTGHKSLYQPGAPIRFEIDGSFEDVWDASGLHRQGLEREQSWAEICRRGRVGEVTIQQLHRAATTTGTP